MFSFLTHPFQLLPVAALVLARLAGLTLAAPLLGAPIIPNRVKIALCFTVMVLVLPVLPAPTALNLSLETVITGLFGELLIGLIMGLSVSMVFTGVQLTGTMIGQQAGLSLGEVINPLLDEQTTVIGQLLNLVTMLLFVMIDGPREFILAVLDTFRSIPLASFRFEESYLELIEELLTAAFTLGLRLAGPALIALLLTTALMGFVTRTIPQLNILTIGFAVQMVVALAVTAVVLGLSYELLYDAFQLVFERVRGAFGLAP